MIGPASSWESALGIHQSTFSAQGPGERVQKYEGGAHSFRVRQTRVPLSGFVSLGRSVNLFEVQLLQL